MICKCTSIKIIIMNVFVHFNVIGGGRFDLGILYFSSEVWCSDNTDAMARMKIQYGTSLAYPARCIGAHVSACPNHITGNYTRAKTRAMVAMCGTFGRKFLIATFEVTNIN